MSDISALPTPVIVERTAQPYVAYRDAVTMQQVAAPAQHFGEIFAWLADQGIAPAGAPFYKYDLIDMERELIIEAGVPVPAVPDVPADMIAGILPAGRYAGLTYVGHPDDLITVTWHLLKWAGEQGLTWDQHETDQGDQWACRLEIFHTDPADEPDMTKWETELAFRLAD